ncbi:MAG: V-type ATP synthase subunit C [Clostridiales bacterium]|nr:V-type ATP synthase subunit C [Clostridiales bacterium]
MLSETRYAYSVARIRVAELNMLSKSRLERMLDSNRVSDAVRVLNEAGYPENNDYEGMLREETADLYAYLKEISPEPEIFDIFSYRYDSHNIKVLLKSELSGADFEELLVDNGVIDKSTLGVLIRERNFGIIPQEFKEAITKSLDTYARTKDPQIIDILVDGAYYRLYLRMAAATGSKFLVKLASIIIDIANISAYIRVKSKMEDLDLLSRVLILGGTIKIKEYMESFSRDIAGFSDVLKGTGYGSLLDILTEASGNVTEFEKACDNYIMEFLRKFRHKAFGIEPLIGYMLGKETDIKNARIILVGKVNRISNDVIRERLRNGYV